MEASYDRVVDFTLWDCCQLGVSVKRIINLSWHAAFLAQFLCFQLTIQREKAHIRCQYNYY